VSERSHDAWLVDLDGTLYTARWVKLAMAMELALGGWGAVPTLRRFRKEHETLREELDGPVDSPFDEQVDRTAHALGIARELVAERVGEWMIDRPGKWVRRFRRQSLLDEIRAFREAGGKTALVSDYPARAKLVALGALDLFDVIVASGERDGPHRLKPDPDGYLRAARSLGADPGRCLVIGDRDDADGEAARAAGMAFRRV
jgi:HAD superfamily hydrolase (TIGR01549 family)